MNGRKAKVVAAVNARYDDRTVAELIPAGREITVYGEPFETEDGVRLYIDPPRRHVWVKNIQVVEPPAGEFRLNWPVKDVPKRVGQEFGANPQNYAKFGLAGHEGRDLYAPTGTEIVAAADGTVKLAAMASADYPAGPAYGNQVRIAHVDGYETIYAHLKDIAVTPGQTVKAGDVIGHADDTGNSFGSHLHLTLKKAGTQTPGYPAGIIDPKPYMEL